MNEKILIYFNHLVSNGLYNIAFWISLVSCISIIVFFILKLSLKKYYRHVYEKHGIEGFKTKYSTISKIFAKPDEILGLKKKDFELEQEFNSQKDLVYMHNYMEDINLNSMYKDDIDIVGINEPIGPMTEKIHQERRSKGLTGFKINKFLGGYWVNYVMMGKEKSRSVDKDGISM